LWRRQVSGGGCTGHGHGVHDPAPAAAALALCTLAPGARETADLVIAFTPLSFVTVTNEGGLDVLLTGECAALDAEEEAQAPGPDEIQERFAALAAAT